MANNSRAGKGRRPRPHFFSKMKRACSERTLTDVMRYFARQIHDSVLAESLRMSFLDNTLHLWADWDPAYEQFSTHDYRWLRRIVALRSKSDDLDLGIDRKAAAWEKYCESELACKIVNRNLDTRGWKPFPLSEQVFLYARQKIADILGDCPSLEDLACRFGPGASVSCRKKTTARHKLSAPLGISLEARGAFPQLQAAFPVLCNDCYVVEHATLEFAPKNAKTDRTVEIQALLNTFVQLGIGSDMKRRLVKAGINLYDQSINRNRARLASLTAGIATLDFTSASDRIARNLVRDLLPFEWFCLLETWRCGTVTYEGRTFETEKFSAMGNGYTFELESLLFYAITWATFRASGVPFRDSDITIFGDDLICPAAGMPALEEVFAAIGFKLNATKSFADGPFRESCGGDYLHGENVRPCYIKGRLTSAALTTLHNSLFRNGEYEAADFVASKIDVRFRLFGPDGYGDGHLLGDYTPTYVAKRFGSFTFLTHVAKGKDDKAVDMAGDWKYPSYTAYLAEAIDRSEFDQYSNYRTPAMIPFAVLSQIFPGFKARKDSDSEFPNLRGIQGSKTVRVYAFGHGSA